MSKDSFVPDEETPATSKDSFVPETPAVPTTSAKVPFFGDTVQVNPSAQPGEWRMRSLAGGGEPSMAEEWTRAGLTLPANLLAGRSVGKAAFKDAAANEQVTQILNRTGRYPNAPRPEPTAPGRLGSVGTTGPGGLMLDVAEFLPIVGRIIKAARMGQKILPTGPGQAVDMTAPAMGGGPVPPGLTHTPIVPQGQVGPAFQPAQVGVVSPAPPLREVQFPPFQPATVGIAPPRPDAVRPPPAWQQPKAVTIIIGDTGPTGASAGASGRGAQPAAPAQLPMTREHRPAGTGHPGTPRDWPQRPPADPPPGPMTMPGPSGTAELLAKDSVLRDALAIAQQWKNQHNKGFKHGGKVA